MNPGQDGQVMISPRRGAVFCSIANGIMEGWKNGILGIKTDDDFI
jgi:hypothetical protein